MAAMTTATSNGYSLNVCLQPLLSLMCAMLKGFNNCYRVFEIKNKSSDTSMPNTTTTIKIKSKEPLSFKLLKTSIVGYQETGYMTSMPLKEQPTETIIISFTWNDTKVLT